MKLRHLRRFIPNSAQVLLGILFLCSCFVFLYPQSGIVRAMSDISTPLLALLTAAYVVLTYHLLKSTYIAINEEHRPYVVASLYTHKYEVYCNIENFGDRPAYSINVSFNPPLDVLSRDGTFSGWATPMMSQTFMPPHFKIHNMVSTTYEALNIPSEKKVFAVHVSYKDVNGKKYVEEYSIDANAFLFKMKIIDVDIDDEIKQVASNLADLNKTLENVWKNKNQ